MPAVQTEDEKLAELLTEREIPVFYDRAGDYYQLKEIQQIHNLLEWIDRPLQDLPLMSVLNMPLFHLLAEELSRIRLKHPQKDAPFYEAFQLCPKEKNTLGEKCRGVLEKLYAWQIMAETLRNSELLWYSYEEKGTYHILSVQSGGEINQANLRMHVQQAVQVETKGILTMRRFQNTMKDQMSYGDQQSSEPLGGKDNLVRIMIIHKSKRLQFPVVFCFGTNKAAEHTETTDLCMQAD